MKTLTRQKLANKLARKAGYLRATKIIDGDEAKVVSTIKYGYRKYTTNAYVSNSYRRNFGWKNTYYQRAEVVVMLPKN